MPSKEIFPDIQIIDWFLKDDISAVYFKKKKNFSYLANLALRGYGIKRKKRFGKLFIDREVKFLTSPGKDLEGFEFSKGGEIPELKPDKKPRIVIDLGFDHLMRPVEKASLEVQLRYILNNARILYWDTCIYTINKEFYPFEKLKDYPKNIVLLDPYGEKEFQGMKEDKTYLILGIVDKGNRLKGFTSKFAEEMGFKTERITLRGKLEGIAQNLDAIVKTLLLTLRGFSVEDAILLSSPRRFLEYRLETELKKKEKDEVLIEKLREYLKIDRELFVLKKF